MGGTVTILPEPLGELEELLIGIDGIQRGRYLAIATLCCYVYDLLLTYNDEVCYFWGGPWTVTRILFFMNRYFPIPVLILGILGFFAPNLSVAACSRLIHSVFILTICGVAIVQAIIVLRICYVYSKNPLARVLLVGTWLTTSLITLVLFGTIWHDIDPFEVVIPGVTFQKAGCTAPPSRQVWKLFVPNLVFHTILYLATTIPALRMRKFGKRSQLMDRLWRDGGIFYFIVLVAATFSTIGSLARSELITVPAIYSNVILTFTAIAVSRLMLSIRSLAARLSLSPDWLLNNTELARVNWKPGRREGELIVEVDAIEHMEMNSVEHDDSFKRSRTPMLHTTRVGVLEHSEYPGTREFKAPPRLPKKPKPTHACSASPPPRYEPQPVYHDPTLVVSYTREYDEETGVHIVR